MSILEANDVKLLALIAEDELVKRRLKNVELVRSSSTFVLARAVHVSTRRSVLLSIARPGDQDALRQLGAVRELLSSTGDERIGTVIDAFWPGNGAATHGWGCLATTWHEGLHDAVTEFSVFGREDRPRAHLLRSIRALIRQIEKVHDCGFAHGDISLANVGFDESGNIHLVDFEHVVHASNLDRSRIAMTPGYVHPRKLQSAAGPSVDLEEHQTWDRYALGQLILNLLANTAPNLVTELTPRNQRALHLIGCLLLDGQNGPKELSLGLPVQFFGAESFGNLRSVVDALERVIGLSDPVTEVPELRPSTVSVLEVGLIQPVAFTERTRELLQTSPMRFLGEFNQLGLISLIWATATHRRLEHAIGTYGLAAQATRSLYDDPENPLFQVLMTPYRVRVLLLAALLHDIGHYPLVHDLEEAYISAFDHEKRSVLLITEHPEIVEVLARSQTKGGWDVSALDVASVIADSSLDGSTLSSEIVGLLHSIISGPIDIDKLDYLLRDSTRLNVQAGQGLDVTRLLNGLTTAVVDGGRGDPPSIALAVREKARRPAELVGRIRSHMFGVAYWHHAYRSIKAMIHWLVWTRFERDHWDQRSAVVSIEYVVSEMVGRLGPQGQQPLLSVRDGSRLERGTLPEAEFAVLCALGENGDETSRELLLLLSRHRWFAAVLTVEHYLQLSPTDERRAVTQDMWEALDRVYRLKKWDYPKKRLQLSRRLQAAVVEWFSPRLEGNAETIVSHFSDRKSNFLVACHGRQIFLVDGPDPERRTSGPLIWSHGERRGAHSVDPNKPISSSRSYDGERLSEEFVATNGAIRVLCHPDFEAFVRQSMTRKDLLGILADVLSEATADKVAEVEAGRNRPRPKTGQRPPRVSAEVPVVPRQEREG